MRGPFRVVLLSIAALPIPVLVACSAFSSSGEAAPTADGASDVAADAVISPEGSVDDGGSADSDADSAVPPTNLLANGTFEGVLGCGGWSATNGATLAPDTTAHSGSGSCRVCRNGSTVTYGLVTFTTGPRPPGTYAFAIWTHAAPDGGPPPTSINTSMVARYVDGGLAQGVASPGAAPSGTWQQMSALVTSAEVSQTIEIDMFVPDGECWLVDDAIVVAQ